MNWRVGAAAIALSTLILVCFSGFLPPAGAVAAPSGRSAETAVVRAFRVSAREGPFRVEWSWVYREACRCSNKRRIGTAVGLYVFRGGQSKPEMKLRMPPADAKVAPVVELVGRGPKFAERRRGQTRPGLMCLRSASSLPLGVDPTGSEYGRITTPIEFLGVAPETPVLPEGPLAIPYLREVLHRLRPREVRLAHGSRQVVAHGVWMHHRGRRSVVHLSYRIGTNGLLRSVRVRELYEKQVSQGERVLARDTLAVRMLGYGEKARISLPSSCHG